MLTAWQIVLSVTSSQPVSLCLAQIRNERTHVLMIQAGSPACSAILAQRFCPCQTLPSQNTIALALHLVAIMGMEQRKRQNTRQSCLILLYQQLPELSHGSGTLSWGQTPGEWARFSSKEKKMHLDSIAGEVISHTNTHPVKHTYHHPTPVGNRLCQVYGRDVTQL